MTRFLISFLRREAGAVLADHVLLCAMALGLGLAVASATAPSVTELAETIPAMAAAAD